MGGGSGQERVRELRVRQEEVSGQVSQSPLLGGHRRSWARSGQLWRCGGNQLGQAHPTVSMGPVHPGALAGDARHRGLAKAEVLVREARAQTWLGRPGGRGWSWWVWVGLGLQQLNSYGDNRHSWRSARPCGP